MSGKTASALCYDVPRLAESTLRQSGGCRNRQIHFRQPPKIWTLPLSLSPPRDARHGIHDICCGTMEIVYDIPSGVQLGYHENPGLSYRGTLRVAYLPDTLQGRQLLARLKYAWKHGLIFEVGTSLTTGETNVVTWSSIHHKTSLKGSRPELSYNCNESLNALYVPDVDTCALQEEQGDLC